MTLPTIREIENNTKPVYAHALKIKIVKDLVYRFEDFVIVVPKGFISDGTSTPRMMWVFFDRFDKRFLAGAILHDYMLVSNFLDRSTADQFFRMILKETAKFPLWFIYYIGVRIGTCNAILRKTIQHKTYPHAKERANFLMK